jgi:ABC-2 type transport system ATP-binding protein
MTALSITGLTKTFGHQRAVDDISLTLPERSVYGFLGANGAGKTTTLRLVLGLLRADAGEIVLFGERVRWGRRPRAAIGALIENPLLYPHLTGRETLDLTRRILDLPRSEIDRVLELVDLSSAGAKRVGGYSLGMRQRLALARALLGKPRLLLLDEPTNGLDPDGIAAMRSLLRALPQREEITLLVSSHLLGEVQEIATHVGLMHRGRMLVEDHLDRLLEDDDAILVETGNNSAAAVTLSQAGWRVHEDGPRLRIESGNKDNAPAPGRIARTVMEAGHELLHISRNRPRLEDVYHREIARAAA